MAKETSEKKRQQQIPDKQEQSHEAQIIKGSKPGHEPTIWLRS
jgi:hypothetical protein